MNCVLSYIGRMPAYVIYCVSQLRLFFDGPVYIVHNFVSQDIRAQLESMHVTWINYADVMPPRFPRKAAHTVFEVFTGLGERRNLFIRAYERLFILETMMGMMGLEDVWGMELDIMMYMNPDVFLPVLRDTPYCFAYHQPDHCSAGIIYLRDYASIQDFMHRLERSTIPNEMKALYETLSDTTTLFPLMYPQPDVCRWFWKDFDKFGQTLFDGAIMGIYYFGLDPCHTGGKIVKENINIYDLPKRYLNIWKYGKLIWKTNPRGIACPFFKTHDGQRCFPVANLHIHSKDLGAAHSLAQSGDCI